ncbi:hypothetical protein MCP1_130034 [Candidatus Terasakiella magnetica]|nr:hypothetical protein MCP1_130034 [Candidatus Terasakiella magnetica]
MEPRVKPHPYRELVLAALKTSQKCGESSPTAMARAVQAIIEADPKVSASHAFSIVWNIWE